MQAQDQEKRLPEINIPVKTEVVRLPDGLVVKRTTMSTGNCVDSIVFPGDHPDARQIK